MKILEFLGLKPKPTAAMVQLTETQNALRLATDPKRKAALQRDVDELSADVAFDECISADPQKAAITAARDQLRQLGALLAGTPDSATRAQMVIEVAIHHGAPIYNEGSHIGCAVIYDYAARLILRMLEGKRDANAKAVVQRFGEVGFDPITPWGASKRAWELRRAFDEIMDKLTAHEPVAARPQPAAGGPATRKPVFVSHASADGSVALAFVELLESAGVPCWIAPRNIRVGTNYSEAIMEAIKSADVTLVLLTSQSNTSRYVSSEIERAANYSKTVIAIRLEPVLPSPALELFTGPRHWVDFWEGEPNREANLQKLVDSLQSP